MKQNYAYHYSEEDFDTLKSTFMLGGDKEETKISMFLAPVKSEYFKEYKKQGFEPYKDVKYFYEYKISILDNALNFKDEIYITSTPEQIEYDNVNWDKFWKKHDGKNNKSDEEYKLLRKKYKEEWREVYLETYKDLTAYRHPSHPAILKLILNYDDYIEYNILNGNKNQYASYVPHIHTQIFNPLIIESKKKIKF